jgi:signal peptidase I
MTEDAQDAPAPKGGFVSELVEIVKTITVALLIALVLRIFLFQPYTIPSGSEEPNLYQGDYIIVSKYSYGYSKHSIPFSPPLFNGRIFFHAPRRGDIIVFKLPRQPHVDYIKRLMGLPGDHIQVRAGIVYINGRPLPRQFVKTAESDLNQFGPVQNVPVNVFKETNPEGRSYLSNSFPELLAADNTGVYVVPPHCYFMMGDNRDNSLDSRFDPGMSDQPIGPGNCGWNPAVEVPSSEYGVGFVPEQNLVGRAQLVLLSWNRDVSLFKPWTWFLDARPSRFFHILK